MPRPPDAAALGAHLGGLRVRVEAARYERFDVVLEHDPEGRRPSAQVVLSGLDCTGRGEMVSWPEQEHRAAAETLSQWQPKNTTVAGESHSGMPPHLAAALQSALIDLGLRQAGDDACQPPRGATLHYVVSFAQTSTPLERVAALARVYQRPEFKVDISPGWSNATLQALAPTTRIIDLKGRYPLEDMQRIRNTLPNAVFEDAPPAWRPYGPWAKDQTVLSAADVQRGAQYNIKVPRLGGVLPALATIARCQEVGAHFYWGGMFEVGVGRVQAQQLALLFCPTATNDLAPLVEGADSLVPKTLTLAGDLGFGPAIQV